MNNKIKQYLQKGFIWDGDYSEFGPPTEIVDISYSDAKHEFWKRLNRIIERIANDESVLWTMSSGADTSTILSHLKYINRNAHTICIDGGSSDTSLSKRLAKDWGFSNHVIVSINKNEMEHDLIKLNTILTSPAAHPYIFMAYNLFKYAKDNGFQSVVMGDGSDSLSLGASHMQDVFEVATSLKEYDLKGAEKVICDSSYIENTTLDYNRFLLNSITKHPGNNQKYNTKYFINIWGVTHIPEIEWKLEENNIKHRIWAEWVQYLIRLESPSQDISKGLNVKKVSPFIEMKDFFMSLPFHYRYALNSKKHIMLDTYGKELEPYSINKERAGFNVTYKWVGQNEDVVEYLYERYVVDEHQPIHEHIDINKDIFSDLSFYKKWTLINLSIWLSIHGSV